jgi:hypothetical protein
LKYVAIYVKEERFTGAKFEGLSYSLFLFIIIYILKRFEQLYMTFKAQGMESTLRAGF